MLFPEVKEAAHYTTKAIAGHGAIREAVELVLKSKGIWEALIDKARGVRSAPRPRIPTADWRAVPTHAPRPTIFFLEAQRLFA